MNVENKLLSSSADVAVHSAGETNPARAGKVGKAALEFESILLSSLLESMEQSVDSLNPEANGGANESLKGFGVQALGAALASRGGVGIGKMLLPYLQRKEHESQAATKLAHDSADLGSSGHQTLRRL
jgi:Rod binding domain-containing protein